MCLCSRVLLMQKAPLTVRNIPKPASRIPTPSTQGKKRTVFVAAIDMCIDGQEASFLGGFQLKTMSRLSYPLCHLAPLNSPDLSMGCVHYINKIVLVA